jgi:Family of unknown function (DUF5681)
MPRKPPEGRRFKPGESGNPEGARRHNPVLRQIRRLTKAQLADFGSMLLDLSVADAEAASRDKVGTSLLKGMMMGQVSAAIKGNPAAYKAILESIVGKPKERIELSGEVAMKQRHTELTDDELKQLYKEKAERLKRLLGDDDQSGDK